MWSRLAVVAVLALTGCAAQRAEYAAERDASSLSFQGPLRTVALSSAQIKSVQKAIAASLKDQGHASFGQSYRAGTNAEGEIVVCGYVNGKKFVGMFAKPVVGPPQFLPVGVSTDEQEEADVKQYCRDDGIYLPQ
jgi:hypothetical protein